MNLEDLRKQFIVSEDTPLAGLESIVRVLKDYAVVTEAGHVHIVRAGLTLRVQIQMVLVSRAIAAKLDKAIPSVVSLDELQQSLRVGREQLRARISDLVRERFAEALGGGTYRVSSHQIEQFVDRLANREVVTHAQGRSAFDSGSRHKRRALGAAPRSASARAPQLTNLINALVESGFFQEPKDLRAVQAGLAEKGHRYPLTSLSSAMLRQVRRRNLRRIKDKKLWTYVIA